MTDIENAIQILKSRGLTCVLCRGNELLTSEKPGIAPMLDFIDEGKELAGFSAADRIIGKAAALLFVCAGVGEVYGEVMSRAAVPVLEKAGIKLSYGQLTDMIVNRKGDGCCPMEAAVKDISDPETAVIALKKRLAELKTASK